MSIWPALEIIMAGPLTGVSGEESIEDTTQDVKVTWLSSFKGRRKNSAHASGATPVRTVLGPHADGES